MYWVPSSARAALFEGLNGDNGMCVISSRRLLGRHSRAIGVKEFSGISTKRDRRRIFEMMRDDSKAYGKPRGAREITCRIGTYIAQFGMSKKLVP
jgi:hypothetical protein